MTTTTKPRRKTPYITAARAREMLEKRGYPISLPTMTKLTDMLFELGMIEKRERPGMQDVNIFTPRAVDKLESYLRARRENPEVGNLRHSVTTWRMLINLGFMEP